MLGHPESTLVAVDSCEAPRVGVDGRQETVCLLREVVGAPGAYTAADDAFLVIWPQFSRRPEGWHRSFRDPVAGRVFAVRFDPRPLPGIRIGAAEPTDGEASCAR